MKSKRSKHLASCAAIGAFFLLIVLAAIAALIWADPGGGRDSRNLLRYLESVINDNGQPRPERLVFSRREVGGVSVIIEDERIIDKIMAQFADAELVNTREYRYDPARARYSVGMRVYLEFASNHHSMPIRSGGKRDLGIGFLVEREEDAHWFYGAWDPWPTEAYWINVFPYEWLDHPPDTDDELWAYEIFTFLFWGPFLFSDIELRVHPDGMDYRVSRPDLLDYGDAENALIELGSIKKFFAENPELGKIRRLLETHPELRPWH